MPKRWLFKTEPDDYSYDDLEKDKKTVWDGVSSNLALKNLREVRMGDQILIYHTGSEKAIVGLAEAITDACPDPKQQDEKAIVVSIKPKRRFPHSATLAAIKLKEGLKEFELTRLPQLSVMPVGNEHWDLLMEMLE